MYTWLLVWSLEILACAATWGSYGLAVIKMYFKLDLRYVEILNVELKADCVAGWFWSIYHSTVIYLVVVKFDYHKQRFVYKMRACKYSCLCMFVFWVSMKLFNCHRFSCYSPRVSLLQFCWLSYKTNPFYLRILTEKNKKYSMHHSMDTYVDPISCAPYIRRLLYTDWSFMLYFLHG